MTLLIAALLVVLARADDPATPPPTTIAESTPVEYLTLPEALRLGLDRSESIRVLSMGAGGLGMGTDVWMPPNRAQLGTYRGWFDGDRIITDHIPPARVGPHDADILIAAIGNEDTKWAFKATAIGVLNAVEVAYWALWEAQEQESAYARAIRLGSEAIERERVAQKDVIMPHAIADIPEAEEVIDHLRQHWRAARAVRVAADRELRARIAPPGGPGEGRRLILVTPPLTATGPTDFAAVRQQRDTSEPTIHQAREALLAASFRDAISLSRGPDDEAADLAASAIRDRRQAELTQALTASDASLVRLLATLGAGTQVLAASGLARDHAALRLQAQQGYFAEGRITVDRLLVACEQDATEQARHASTQADHARARVAFEVAQGTLLTHDGVNVAMPPAGRKKTYISARDPGHPPIRVPIDPSSAPPPLESRP